MKIIGFLTAILFASGVYGEGPDPDVKAICVSEHGDTLVEFFGYRSIQERMGSKCLFGFGDVYLNREYFDTSEFNTCAMHGLNVSVKKENTGGREITIRISEIIGKSEIVRGDQISITSRLHCTFEK